MRANWRLTLASGVGVLLAITITSVGVLYSRVLAESGIKYAIDNNTSGILLNHQLFVQDHPLGPKDYQRLDQLVTRNTNAHLAWLSNDMVRYGQSEEMAFVFNREDSLPLQDIPAAYLFFREDLQGHSSLLEGRWPKEPFLSDGILQLEAILGNETSNFLQWELGKTIFLVPFADAQEDKVAVTIVGIAHPTDPTEDYWFSDLSEFRVNFDAEEEDADFVVPMYIGESNFFDGIGKDYPMLLAQYRWYTFLRYNTLNALTAIQARDSLVNLESDINQGLPRALAFTSLGNLVDTYERQLSLAKVLLFLFVALAIGVVLYYVILLAIMLARERGAEAAILRSRGASGRQAGALLGLGEGLLISIPAFALGPPIALLIARFLPTGDIELGQIEIGLSWSVYLGAAITVLICVGVFLAIGIGIASKSIVAFLREHAREPTRSPIYRYAVDGVVLVSLALFWYQINSRSGFVTKDFEGAGLGVDLSLLLGPFLVLVAASLILLRIMPWLLLGMSRLANFFSPLWLVHGLRRMSRDPISYGTLSILLMLATALIVFGSLFGTTLSRGQGDRVRYAIGGDIVMPPEYVPAHFPDAEAIMPLYRGNFATRGNQYAYISSYSTLGVEPTLLPKVTWFRDDFADKNLEELLRPLRTPLPVEGTIQIPEGAESIGIWVKVDRPFVGYDVTFALKDDSGRHLLKKAGNVGAGTWTHLEADLPQGSPWRFPLSLSGILVNGKKFSVVPDGSGWLAIDEVTVVIDKEIIVIEDFESIGAWKLIPNMGTATDQLTFTPDAAYSGDRGALLTWAEPINDITRGLIIPPVPMPIPVIGSDKFYPGQELIGTLEGIAVRVVIADVVEYFPTLYSDIDAFLIISLDHLLTYSLAIGSNTSLPYTEVWIGLTDAADQSRTVSELQDGLPLGKQVIDREVRAHRAEGNPLQGGAWAPIALLDTVAIGIVAVLGFVLYGGLTIKKTRLELGVLQAVGFTNRQVGYLLGMEGLIVGALSIGVGLGLGAWLGSWTLGYLSVTEAGKPLVPALALSADRWLLTLGLTEVLIASLGSILISLALATRLRLYEVLRIEE